MKWCAKEMPKIIYCDNHLLALDKPCGMLTQPSGTDLMSLECWAKAYLKEKFQKKGNVFLEAVHRLDRGASGIVLFARTSKALSRCQEHLRKKEWEKTYLAFVEGPLEEDEGMFEDLLQHDDHRATIGQEGKLSTLFFKVLKREKGGALVEIKLVTGRYHQIRVQFASRGHPIFGDEKYGSKKSFQGIALHHAELIAIHPVTYEKICFKSAATFAF
jgi:23S rRNA pseudouridine1911/1915/1917 synthase